ncbi:quinone oxidoreductase family protein [Streptomyces iconiensis]|uniref:Zinc-binding alcohol dehydrogenase family protein n=1 Tax=Streptomyces iconiensis TaxID=1384038 RepID=A0ABT6ZSU4_9ACTN|nr:zinc-binding alcohol dehydrogenase family protein [Streptomyces iconiensis]MDJ1132143.1 zinc-binding alcohol dehydrogenase family protein [Streptomyces iconiensis]
MRTSRLYAWGKTVEIEETGPLGQPADGEVMVAMEAAAVGHLDLTVMTGTFSYRPELPFTPGAVGVGTVTAGEPSLVGKRVLVRGGGVGLERAGTWAQQVAAPVDAVRVVPDGADAALVATWFAPVTTAWAALGPVGRISEGERVLVTGPRGGVGSMAVQLAARAGAHVIALVRDEKEAAAVPSAAAEVVIGQGRAAQERLAALGGVDAVLDTVGGDTVPTLLPAIAPGGRVVMIGYVAGKTLTLDLPNLMAADVSLLPVNMVRRSVPDDVLTTLLTELGSGTFALNTLTFPLTDLNKALEVRAGSGVSGTVAVTM